MMQNNSEILDAINNQRWYFFQNKPKVLMDRDTGLLWPNLMYFAVSKEWFSSSESDKIESIANSFVCDGFIGWKLPTFDEIKTMIEDKTFPFWSGDCYHLMTKVGRDRFGHNTNEIEGLYYKDGRNRYVDLSYYSISSRENTGGEYSIISNNDLFVKNTNYKALISSENPVYTERERLQLTLDIFIKNKLIPIFEDDEITELYKKIYIKEPRKQAEQTRIQEEVKRILDEKEQETIKREIPVYTADYEKILSKYNADEIDHSVIKYYQSEQKLIDEFMTNLSLYEKENEGIIRKFNNIGSTLPSKYDKKESLTDDENSLLESRQAYFQSYFAFGINTVKSKIQSVRKEADILEQRINELENTEEIYQSLAEIEQEKRPSFSFVADYLVKIIRQAMKKMEFFESHQKYIETMVSISQKWDADYQMFKTSQKENFKQICEDDSIEEEIWSVWYQDWQKARLLIEKKVQPIIEYGLKAEIELVNPDAGDTVERLLQALEQYKDEIDKFYLEERRHIYENYAFQSGGDLQDKLQTEKTLYGFTAKFQADLQDIIFNCKDADDRVFILNWANDLLDIQIDEILAFVEDNSFQHISKIILDGFAELKYKNFDAYLSDAKAYADEKVRREKEYNSLIFKMRKAK